MLTSKTSTWRIVFRRLCHSLRTEEENIIANGHSATAKEQTLKSLRIAILGLPNAGKSTLINQLINRPVCAASSKVHTTRSNARAVYTKNDTQLIFVDTPGLIVPGMRKKFHLEESCETDSKRAMQEVQAVGIVHDLGHVEERDKLSNRVLNLLKAVNKDAPIVLILNKIDKIRRKKCLLDLINVLNNNQHYPKFQDTFLISALTGNGVDDLRNYFLDLAKPQGWDFEPDIQTDQSAIQIIERTVKARVLECLRDEVPYSLQVKVTHFYYFDDASMRAAVSIQSPFKRYIKIVKGGGGRMITKIAKDSEQDLCNIFRTNVVLHLAIAE